MSLLIAGVFIFLLIALSVLVSSSKPIAVKVVRPMIFYFKASYLGICWHDKLKFSLPTI